MSILSSMAISASGLAAQRTRVNVAASNLANAQSTGPDGPYKRRDPVLEAVPTDDGSAAGVQVSRIVTDPTPGPTVYMPGHPDADASGMVSLPNVDPVHEIVNLISAERGFQANATALETAETLASRALDLIS